MANEPIKCFSQHLLALVGTYVTADESVRDQYAKYGVPPSAERIHFVYSGVPVIHDDKWYVLTAGHSIAPYVDAIAKQQIFSTGVSLVDSLGTDDPVSPAFPFEIKDNFDFAIDEPEIGLDYAMLRLSQNHVDLIKTNVVTPLKMELSDSGGLLLDRNHVAMGFPTEKTDLLSVNPGGINDIYLKPYSVPILRNNNDDCEFPRFVGRIKNMDNLDSIVGISGGPIFCFSDDGKRYTIAAVQSRWDPKTKTVYATEISSIIRHFSARNEA